VRTTRGRGGGSDERLWGRHKKKSGRLGERLAGWNYSAQRRIGEQRKKFWKWKERSTFEKKRKERSSVLLSRHKGQGSTMFGT